MRVDRWAIWQHARRSTPMTWRARHGPPPVGLAAVLLVLAAATWPTLVHAQTTACFGCLSCEDCLEIDELSQCVDACDTPGTGLYCAESGGGTCLPFCQASDCLVWSVAEQACVTTCVGCTTCSGAGTCVVDESVRNPCGKCPGDEEYDTCYVIPGDLKTSSCIAVQDSPMPLLYRLARAECAIVELTRLEGGFDCLFDSDCNPPNVLATCDPCKEAYCDIDSRCNTRFIDPFLYPAEYAAAKCGACSTYGNNCTLARPCAIDMCVENYCVHLVGAPCVYLE